MSMTDLNQTNPDAKADRMMRNRHHFHDSFQVNQMILHTSPEQEETNDLSDTAAKNKPVRQILI